MNMYSAGKKGGSVSASMGKKSNCAGTNVGYSAGQKSGTARDGDPKGAPAMGKGK